MLNKFLLVLSIISSLGYSQNRSLQFDGNDYIYKDDDGWFNADGNWSINGWMKFDNSDGSAYLLSTSHSGNGYPF